MHIDHEAVPYQEDPGHKSRQLRAHIETVRMELLTFRPGWQIVAENWFAREGRKEMGLNSPQLPQMNRTESLTDSHRIYCQ